MGETGCNQETGKVDLGVEECECYMEVKRRNMEGRLCLCSLKTLPTVLTELG